MARGVLRSKVTVRQFQSQDAEGVSALIARTMRVSNAGDYPLERLDALIAYFTPEKLRSLARERVCFVAVHLGDVVGTAAREGSDLVTFFVDPAFQRQGIGAALLRRLEQDALAAALTQLRVEASITGAGFYERQGYQRTGAVIGGTAGPQIALRKQIWTVSPNAKS